MARRAAYRRKRQNRFGMFLVTTVIVMMLVVVMVKRRTETETCRLSGEGTAVDGADCRRREAFREIAEYEKYTQTKQYIEEVAKDKLGLVYEGEIILKMRIRCR